MGIAVFADKFSGTLSSNEVINEVNKIFKYNDIKASFFPVTDGGEGSTEIFKQYGFKTNENLMLQDFTGKWIPVETLTINKHIYLETSQLIGINNSEINTLDLNSSCIAKIIDNVDVLSMGGSKTNDAGIGLLSKMGIDFLKNDEIIKDLSTGAQGEMEHIDDDDDDDDDYDEVYNKIERASDIIHGNNNTISRDKMLPLLIVKRNKNNVIVDDNHKTIPLLTKYEKTKIIGLRAVQLANGLKPFIEVPEDVIEPTVIADMELKQKKIPFILKRPVSLTRFEYWPINELEII